jgi:V/A-type H+/Na+-transporting ATPase subunit G/H
MTTISEAITTIKKAENDADGLIDDSKKNSFEMIEDARTKSKEIVAKAKEDANNEAENILFEAETNAKKEAYKIANTTAEEVEVSKKKASDMVEEAADIIVKSVL